MYEHTAPTTGIESNNSIATPQPSTPSGMFADFSLQSPVPTPKSNWDIAQVRLPQDYAAVAQEIVQATIPVDKPGPQVYFQVHPHWQLVAASLKHEDCLYLVSSSLREALEGDVKIKLIVPYSTRDGVVGLWPLNPLQAAGRTDAWTASAHRILVAARAGWVRMRSNMSLRTYDLIKPKAIWDEPVWPEKDFEELIGAAFEGRVINTLDHPVVRALRGEA